MPTLRVPLAVSPFCVLLAIASAALGEDLYRDSRRTLEALELSHLDKRQMQQLLKDGIPWGAHRDQTTASRAS